jgi:hypothetical protein
MPMSRKIAEELLPRLRLRSTGRGRKGRSLLIDELCGQWGYSRKHAIKLLGAKTGWGGDPAVRKGRPPKYDSEVEEVLWRIWKVSEQPCGKRLQALLPQWLPHYEGEYGRLVESRGHTNCLWKSVEAPAFSGTWLPSRCAMRNLGQRGRRHHVDRGRRTTPMHPV